MYGELAERVPKQYRNASPSSSHCFNIRGIWHGYDTVTCEVLVGTNYHPVVLSWSNEPELASALAGLESLTRNGYWPAKYLALFKVAEAMKLALPNEAVALRHALAHAPEVLSRPSTVKTLEHLFGGVEVRFEDKSHCRTFWRLFGEMLVAVDIQLAQPLQQLACKKAPQRLPNHELQPTGRSSRG